MPPGEQLAHTPLWQLVPAQQSPSLVQALPLGVQSSQLSWMQEPEQQLASTAQGPSAGAQLPP